MQAKKRFSLIFLLFLFAAYVYFHRDLGQDDEAQIIFYDELPSYLDFWMEELGKEAEIGPSYSYADENIQTARNKKCRMETCFDYSRCRNDFKIYIYPDTDQEENEVLTSKSPSYQKILEVVTESRYYTGNPEKACLFILSIDTLDRDPLSPDYIRNVQSKLHDLKYWNGGRNHLVFNLYSGSWPNYEEEDLGFDTGEAIVAKASISVTALRPAFDISIPLFPKVSNFVSSKFVT